MNDPITIQSQPTYKRTCLKCGVIVGQNTLTLTQVHMMHDATYGYRDWRLSGLSPNTYFEIHSTQSFCRYPSSVTIMRCPALRFQRSAQDRFKHCKSYIEWRLVTTTTATQASSLGPITESGGARARDVDEWIFKHPFQFDVINAMTQENRLWVGMKWGDTVHPLLGKVLRRRRWNNGRSWG